MTARSILQVFDTYQKARICFVQAVADLALRQQNMEYLCQAGVLDLLIPLFTDPCMQIQQCAAIAVGRLASFDSSIAQDVINRNCLPLLLRDLEKQNRYFLKFYDFKNLALNIFFLKDFFDQILMFH
ncbi:hypothetical protein FQR65_LT17713 [Abscondita terminalis]|nr:hypothetical protein FQR65_LT17713 [Abscondita terminalis]